MQSYASEEDLKPGTPITSTPSMIMTMSPHDSNFSWDKSQNKSKTNVSSIATRSRTRPRAFLLVGLPLLQAAGVIGFFVSVFTSLSKYVPFESDKDYQAMLGYLVIFSLATLFEVYIAIDSLLNQNTAQLAALCLFETSMTVFGAMLPREIRKTVEDHAPQKFMKSLFWRLYLIPMIIGTTTLIMAWLTWFFARDFGWKSYKKLGANIQLRNAMQIKSIFFMLQKFTFFFLIGFCVLVVQMRKDQGSLGAIDISLPSLALVSTCLVQIFGSIAVELELRIFLFLYGWFWAVAMAFMGYELAQLHPFSQVEESHNSLILFSCVTICLLFSTGIISLFCYKNFDKGFKDAGEVSLISRPFRKKEEQSRSTIISEKGDLAYGLQDLRAVLD